MLNLYYAIYARLSLRWAMTVQFTPVLKPMERLAMVVRSPIQTDEGHSVVPDKKPVLGSRVRLLKVWIDSDLETGFLFPIEYRYISSESTIRKGYCK